ncbi:uncharacterized protein LOC128549153 [Mercenaria mercenaria]|uniref:uncharacterized protein LOC128549153 n=1 Tax=Mercenaria mercenaria TaxID=6596 RepID=UPI00234E92AD|nr:uncharacterized protein LOC128549153 [Mercenaria mercenaria]XP_053381526.1 uncharacterized protein LOC128549153 [Mercenaria mercenaria]
MAERQKADIEINKLKLSARKRKAVETTNNAELSLAKSPKENKINNLEIYLDDVYRKECVFNGEKEEVEFIKTGIETLVQKIVNLVLQNFSITESGEEYLKRLKENLIEVYFPLKNKQVKAAESSIIKVGSFYEETKNNFPDEFDFIFLLLCVKNWYFQFPLTGDALFTVPERINTVTTDHKESLKYVRSNGILNVTRSIHFDKYVRKHGPASMLRFIYKNRSGEEKYIHVDLSPGQKVFKGAQRGWLLWYSGEDFNPKFKSLCTEVVSSKNILLVDTIPSVTEIEVHFMRNILSKKHVKVYRILKFLIHGHGDGEILELYFQTEGHSYKKGYSSYLITRAVGGQQRSIIQQPCQLNEYKS